MLFSHCMWLFRFMPIEAVPSSESGPEPAPRVAETAPRAAEARPDVPFLLEETRQEQLSRIPKEAAFRTVALGNGGVSPIAGTSNQSVRPVARRPEARVASGQPFITRGTPSVARESSTAGNNFIASGKSPIATGADFSQQRARSSATSKATRKAFKRCHGKCVQKRCLPIGDLRVYEKCVLECTKTCQ